MEKLKPIAKQNSDAPWVLIAASRAWMEMAYKYGGRYKSKSFDPERLETAKAIAEAAVKAGPDISVVHSHLACLQIINGDYRAEEMLAKARAAKLRKGGG